MSALDVGISGFRGKKETRLSVRQKNVIPRTGISKNLSERSTLIKRFELLKTDEEKFWSESLNRRMELMEAKTEQAREAALKRWEKEKQKKQSGRNAAA